jgi:glutamate 5-kinase
MDKSIKREYKRIVVKVGTSLITSRDDYLDENFIKTLVSQISDLQLAGYQMIFVSSGAVAAGRTAMKGIVNDAGELDRQVLAAVGQGRLINVYEKSFEAHSIITAQALLSKRDVNDRLGYLNIRNTLLALLAHGVVPIINENDVVSVDELTGEVFGDNDNLSALVASMIDADLLIILGRIDGMYDKDPNIYSDAELIQTVFELDSNIDKLAGPSIDFMGRGGMVTKIEAAKLAIASGIDVIIANGTFESVITKLINGDKIGTLFKSSGSHVESRKRWMLSRSINEVKIIVDDGAVKALLKNKSSLLPAGLIDIEGKFKRGDVVSIVDINNNVIGMGISNYDSLDIDKITGVQSNKIKNVLGYHFGDEVIHRNNMILL